MSRAVTRETFAAMLREEWRLHARLFGGRRFAAFPLLVALLGGGAVYALVETGTPADDAVAGLHALVFAFGLHTGSLGLVGRDALRGVLEEVTLVVSCSATLPVSRRRLFAVFLAKDALYYAALFLAPLAAGFAPVLPLSRVAVLWVSAVVTFALGVVVTLAAVALSTRGRSGRLALLAAAVGVGLAWASGVDVLAYTPSALYAGEPSAAVGILAVPLLGAVGVLGFDTAAARPARTAGDGFRRYRDRLGDDDGLLAKTLLDVARSSGGYWKVLFSAGVLFGASALMVDVATRVTGVPPSVGVSLGAVLGLTGFTTYNWLTQFDGPETYAALPVSTRAVLAAKFRAFLLLGPPAGLACYAVAVAWRGGPAGELLAGALLLSGLVVYLFGLTVALAGLRPNEFLFDSALFAAFGVGVALPLVPLLVAGFVLAPYAPATLAGLAVAGPLLGAVGVALYRLAAPRWERRYRLGH